MASQRTDDRSREVKGDKGNPDTGAVSGLEIRHFRGPVS